MRGLALEQRAHHVLVQTDAAHGDRRFPGDLLRPAGEVQIGAFEFRVVETPGAGVKHVYAGRRERQQQALELARRRQHLAGVVTELPLRESQHDGEVGADGRAYGLYELDAERKARFERTAIAVGALVQPLPEELVDEIAVGAVQLDTIESKVARRNGRPHVGRGGFVDIGLRHRLRGDALFGMVRMHNGGRSHAGHRGVRLRAGLAVRPAVPQLRNDGAADLVHLVDHLLPPGQTGLTVEAGHVRVRGGRRVVQVRALGDDESRTAFSAAPVVGGDVVARDLAWRHAARHRRHDDAVAEAARAPLERPEERCDGNGGLYGVGHGGYGAYRCMQGLAQRRPGRRRARSRSVCRAYESPGIYTSVRCSMRPVLSPNFSTGMPSLSSTER